MTNQKKNKTIQTTAKQRMPCFNCTCGAKILIVPDVHEMEKAIHNHSVEHRKATGQRLSEEYLTQEILKVVSQMWLL